MKLESKLLKIFECIDTTCTSAVQLFDSRKHTGRSVGIAAYEERQSALMELAEMEPDVISPLCKKGQHQYFKFDGRSIKIISSLRDPLNSNVLNTNSVESEELDLNDPLLRIIFKTDYNIATHQSTVLECYYLEIDRNSGEVINEIDILHLTRIRNGYLEPIDDSLPKAVEIPQVRLLSADDKKRKRRDS